MPRSPCRFPRAVDLTRAAAYFFIDAHTGDYHIAVVADPARPELLLPTDLGLDKLTNRMITLVVIGPLLVMIDVVGLVFARRTVGAQCATLRALSQAGADVERLGRRVDVEHPDDAARLDGHFASGGQLSTLLS